MELVRTLGRSLTEAMQLRFDQERKSSAGRTFSS
jgi:hypothetical protein